MPPFWSERYTSPGSAPVGQRAYLYHSTHADFFSISALVFVEIHIVNIDVQALTIDTDSQRAGEHRIERLHKIALGIA